MFGFLMLLVFALVKAKFIRKEGYAGWTLDGVAQILHFDATKASSENPENFASTMRSVTRDLARALSFSPHSRGC